MDLPGNEVHVWHIPLDPAADRLEALAGLLSADERERAARFHFERDRRRFTAARGALRTTLAGYLALDPAQLQFGYEPAGKPYLAHLPAGESFFFNLAHSHDLALAAVTRGRRVGIDVEYLRPLPDATEIAARFFSSYENSVFQSLPAGQQLPAFFACWTRKEAYIKALGSGLAHPLDSFDVSLAPGEPARLLAVRPDSAEAARWSLAAWPPAPGYVAALIVEGQDWILQHRAYE